MEKSARVEIRIAPEGKELLAAVAQRHAISRAELVRTLIHAEATRLGLCTVGPAAQHTEVQAVR